MTEAVLEGELVAACSSLGFNDGNKYTRDPDCVETIRDLLRYLRRDDSSHQIRLALGDTRVVQTDLIPMLREHSSDKVLLDLVLRLLVNLTSPALLVFHQEVPEDKTGRQMYMRLIVQQQGFKEAFTEAGVWASIASILGAGLQQEGDRDDDTNLLVEMCLVLLRNVLAVAPGRQDDTRTHDDADLHDQVLWSLHLAGLPDLLLYLASTQHEADLSMHTLEIISLMLRQQDPQALATSALHRSKEEQKKDEEELVRVREAERARRQQQTRKHYSARHSRFGGTYYVQNMKSISDRDIIAHKPIIDINNIDFDNDKRGKKIAKNRAPLRDASTTRRSTLAIRLFLQEFCVEFLNGAYNSIMHIVKDNLDRARTQEHDESYYLWGMNFFMNFNRHNEFKLELVSETLSVQTVHYVQTNIETYYEMMTVDKKKIPLWSRRMHNGLRAYQEILMTLAAMDRSQDPTVRCSSLTLKSKVFYVVEYRELPLILLQNYDVVKMSKSYLKDLIETTHIFLRLLEGMCKKTKHLMVQQNQKKKPSKKKKKPVEDNAIALTPEKLEEIWSTLADELAAIIQGEAGELPAVVPFDALSDKTEDEQKEIAMRRINALLRKSELAEAVALFRASREVWPEGDIFGVENISASEEFVCLREVFMADLNPVEQPVEQPPEEEEREEDEERVQEVQEIRAHISEFELDFTEFVRRFAHTKIMQGYALLLKSYATNSGHTNRCIIKLFHRIAWDSKLPAIFFQSSLFVTFHQAMIDPARKSNEIISDIVKFAKYIVKQFFKVAETNPKVFMEILFWKNKKEAVEVECGYDVPDDSKTTMKFWSEEEDDEVIRLYQEFRDREMDPADDRDIADLVLQNLIKQDRTRKSLIKKLKELHLIDNVKQLSKKAVSVRASQWTETEEAELKLLFEEYKDAMDPLGRIMDFMIVPKPKHRVVGKLLELGIIQDKSEVKKKRVPKPKQSRKNNTKSDGQNFLAANEDSGDSCSDGASVDSQETSRAAIKTTAKPASMVVTPYLISAALKKVLDCNLREPIKWIVEIIGEVADDREEDGEFEPIPILPINDEQYQAIENESFQSLMKIIGLQPPEAHQEMFWRVPAKLTIGGLRKRAQYLTQGLEGTLPTTQEVNSAVTPEHDSQISDHTSQVVLASTDITSQVDFSHQTKKKTKNTKRKRKSQDIDRPDYDSLGENEDKENHASLLPSSVATDGNEASSDSEPILRASDASGPLAAKNTPTVRSKKRTHQDEFDTLLVSVSKSSKKRRIIMDDSDDDDNDDATDKELLPINTDSLLLHLNSEEQLAEEMDIDNQSQSNVKRVTKARLIDSDDDSNDGHLGGSETNKDITLDSQGRRTVESDSDDDVPVVRHRAKAIIESDDEEL